MIFDFDMSPYGQFIWPAWGISALVLIALSVKAIASARYWKRELAKLEARKDKS